MKKNGTIGLVLGILCFILSLNAQTWDVPKRLTWTSDSSLSPAAAVDSNDHIYLVWDDRISGDDELYLKKSTDGGTSWTNKRLTWGTGDSFRPAIAIDSNDSIYIVWTNDSSVNDEIYFKKSTNGGTSWTTQRLTWNSGTSDYPDIVTDSNNHIYIVWYDDIPGNTEIYFKKSTNGGTSWITKRLTWTSKWSGGPKIAVDSNNHIYMVWCDSTPGNVEIYFKKSTNGGTSWTTQRCTWNSGNSYYPDLAVDSLDHIHFVWYDWSPGNSEIYHKISTNGGSSWTTNRLSWTSESSYNPAIATDSSNHIHVGWNEENPGNREIYYKRSTNGGASWTLNRLTYNSGGSNDPSIATDSSNNIYVFWFDYTPGNFEIFYKKGIQ